MKEVLYLGQVCSQDGARPDPKLTKCVRDYPVPKTVKQVQLFLGLANYYTKFIPHFSKTGAPITGLRKKGRKI